jgi:DNA-binding NarL/FixJ family response regulator
MYDDERHVFEAFQNGASGYFVKMETAQGLLKIINEVEKKGVSIPRALTSKLIEGIKKQGSPKERFRLTEREINILRLLKQGLSNKEIAQQVFTSEKTVKNHLASIFQKLVVVNRAQAIVKSMEEKII